MYASARMPPRQRGLSLIEQVMFIVIVGAAVAGVLLTFQTTTRHSADPLVLKQATALAEAMLEEVLLMPYTYCDPDDANAATAASPAGCASAPEAIGPEAGEGRYVSPFFDNVNDYHGFAMNDATGGIRDITNAPVGLSGYGVAVTVAQQALGTVAAADSLLVTVTVTGPDNTRVVLQGYRTRYAPNAVP